MHTLLTLSTLLLLVAGCFFLFDQRTAIIQGNRQREFHLFILAFPLVGVGLGALALLHFAQANCFTGAPRWDQVISMLLPGGLLGGVLVALVLTLVRLLWVALTTASRTFTASRQLHQCARALAHRLGLPAPHVRLSPSPVPVAFTYGFFRPTIVLSRWMVTALDAQELETVLAHELAHHARRDHLITWWALFLRDAFCYLPSSTLTYQQLRNAQELACDDLALQVTNHPLGLASALTKVWLYNLGDSAPAPSLPALTGTSAQMEGRIRRLCTPSDAASQGTSSWITLAYRTSILLCLFILSFINILVMLRLMGCGPLS